MQAAGAGDAAVEGALGGEGDDRAEVDKVRSNSAKEPMRSPSACRYTEFCSARPFRPCGKPTISAMTTGSQIALPGPRVSSRTQAVIQPAAPNGELPAEFIAADGGHRHQDRGREKRSLGMPPSGRVTGAHGAGLSRFLRGVGARPVSWAWPTAPTNHWSPWRGGDLCEVLDSRENESLLKVLT